jgi:DNA repair photolyase
MTGTARVARRPSEIQVHDVAAKSALNRVRGMGFGWSLNPYTGCVHQCVFCYARSTHAYRELDGVRDWGSRLTAKVNIVSLLRAELANPRSYRADHIAIGTSTDPYQPIEGRYRLMRGILAALRDARMDFHITTRSPLIVRDLELLTQCARRADVSVSFSLATLDAAIAREIEPTVAPPRSRLRAVRTLADAGIRVSVGIAPILPGITDAPADVHALAQAAADAGAYRTWHSALNLGAVTRDAYFEYLRERRPELIERYERMFSRGRFASRRDVDLIEGVAARATSAVTFAPYRPLPRDESGMQPTLF